MTYDTIERDGYTGEIMIMEGAENPRDMRDSVAVLTQLSDRYTQPDAGYDPRIVTAWEHGRTYRDTEKVERYARAFLGAVAVAWWDDRQGGSHVFGYVTRETAEREGIADPQAALDAEIDEYAAWAVGDVYGYAVTDPAGVEIDSCWGYYGDAELPYIRTLIDAAIDADADDKRATRRALLRRLANR